MKAFSKENLLSQPRGRASLLNEISIMRELNHSNIIRLEEIHESANSVYLVMELLEGGELISHVVDKRSLTGQEIMKVMSDLLKALHHMDRQKIMHRDLKPENMILKFKNSRQD